MELQGKEIPIFNLGEVSVGMLIRVTQKEYFLVFKVRHAGIRDTANF